MIFALIYSSEINLAHLPILVFTSFVYFKTNIRNGPAYLTVYAPGEIQALLTFITIYTI